MGINKRMLITAAVCLAVFNLLAQKQNTDVKERELMIAATQAAASGLFFTVDKSAATINVSGFSASGEFYTRNGLPHFLTKIRKGKKVTVGYIGGSITQATNGYRIQSAAFIQSLFPSAGFRFINAGIAGSGTDLGSCRLQQQLLQYNADLIFIEFAVNGAFANGMEGMVRQIRKTKPGTDICFVYTIYEGQSKIYAEGDMPSNIKVLDSIANHYGIPSVHMGVEAAQLEKENKLTWKGNPAEVHDKVVFSADGIHPTEAGGNLYAAAIARAMKAMKNSKSAVQKTVPPALFADNWEDATMLDPLSVATFSGGWKKVDAGSDSVLKKYKSWFPYIMKADAPGDSMTFRFKGSMFGFFDVGGPEVGQLNIIVDGHPVNFTDLGLRGSHILSTKGNGNKSSELLNRFNVYCNNRHRGQYEFIELAPGTHTVTIKIAPETADKRKILGKGRLDDISANPGKYDRTVFYLGKILVRGTVVH